MADRKNILDLYFLDARARFRYDAFRAALKALESGKPDRAGEVLLAFSDPTDELIPAATTRAACGAWPGADNA